METRPTLIALLTRVWSQQASGSPFDAPSLGERIALSLLILATEVSFRGACARLGRFRVVATESYHVLVVGALIALSCSQSVDPRFSLFLLGYLVYEIVGWSVFDIFVEAGDADLRGRRSALRALLWAVYSYVVVAWAYGIYFWSSGCIVNSSEKALPGLQDGIYFSVITITTIGYGDYTPKSGTVAQMVVISEPLVGIVLLSLYFAVLVSAVAETFRSSIDR